MRFRKSISICKGLKVNFSKSGASFTTGIRGFSYSSGKKGSYLNVGIPGTGLYDRVKVSGSSSSHSSKGRSVASGRSSSTVLPSQVGLHMDDTGKITFTYGNGLPITDEALIRKIKSTPQFKAEKVRIMEQFITHGEREVEEKNAVSLAMTTIHNSAAIVDPVSRYEAKLKELRLQQYVPEPFTKEEPTIESVKHSLETQAKHEIKSIAFWTLKSKRQSFVDENIAHQFEFIHQSWIEQKEAHDLSQAEIANVRNAEYQRIFDDEKGALEAALAGDKCYISVAIENWFAAMELPVTCAIQYDYDEAGTLAVDLDLPEIEDFPSEKAVQLANGTVKIKSKTQAELHSEYAEGIFGLSVFLASHLFNISPKIEQIILSGFTQRRNSKGDVQDEYIISIKYLRRVFEKRNIANLNPKDFSLGFENRCLLSTTNIFKKIEPYDISASINSDLC